MRVDIRVAISDDFSYEYDKMVMKEVQVKGDPEVLSSIPWGKSPGRGSRRGVGRVLGERSDLSLEGDRISRGRRC